MRSRRFGEAFFSDDRLAELDPLARIFFLGLLACADREGRLEDRPRKLKALVLPFDNADPEAMLADFARLGLIRRYEADGRRLLLVEGFRQDGTVAYQRPHPNEAASTLPPPPDNQGTPPRSTKVDHGGDSVTVTVTETVTRAECQGAACPEAAPAAPAEGGSPSGSPGGVRILLKDGTGFEPSAAQLAEWTAAFPDKDVDAELRHAAAWCAASPERRKTRRGVARFVVGWLGRAKPTATAPAAPAPTVAELKAACEARGGAA